MNKRPQFSQKLSVTEFNEFYWYKTELITICRKYDLPTYGTKAELNQYIIQMLQGIPSSQIKAVRKGSVKRTLNVEEITLQTRLLNSGFRLNNEARKFFENYFQVEKFSFNKPMAILMRKVQTENDAVATVQDLVDVYLKKIDLKDNAEEQTYQWNNFVKDFHRDESTKNYTDQMKVAAILWTKVRDSSDNKKYRHSLIEKYHNEIAIYEKLF